MIKKQNFAIVATICDPRFNFNVFQNLWLNADGNANRARVREQFINTFLQYDRREQALQHVAEDAELSRPTIVSDQDSDSELFKLRTVSEFETEYTKWLKQQPIRRDIDIFKYWASKEYEFPTIARVARDHLAIPATSAPSESVFSMGSDIITKKRNRLSGESTRRLLCLRDWGVLEEEDQDSDDIGDSEVIDIWE
jgi:hypothetical protein